MLDNEVTVIKRLERVETTVTFSLQQQQSVFWLSEEVH